MSAEDRRLVSMRTSWAIWLAVAAVSLVAVIVLPGWLVGRSTPELGGVVVIPASGPASAPTPVPAPGTAGPTPSGGGAVQVSPWPPLGAGQDDDDEPDDDFDIGDIGDHGSDEP